jgi:hypothetical protein
MLELSMNASEKADLYRSTIIFDHLVRENHGGADRSNQ